VKRLQSVPQPSPLPKLAYDRLRDSIFEGTLKSGELLNEMALAKELGISRTPLREALFELSVQGLITILPRKGIQVKYFTQEDVEHVFELRGIIELAIIEKLTTSPNHSVDSRELENILEEQRKTCGDGDYIAFLRADNLFHMMICESARNPRIVTIIKDLWSIIRVMGLQGLQQSARWNQILDEHQRILAALTHRHGKTARRAMESHLAESKKGILKRLRDSNQTSN
jgi:GntR family transcriptional regulator, rspAB operon transcriptional repressor